METLSTSTINPIDLINLLKDIAQLNLGYLGISVAILGVLGGVFVYFNIKPLKDTLDKQEKAIEELRKEAQGLLSKSAGQAEEMIKDFKTSQSESLYVAFEQQEEKIKLGTTNKIQEVERLLSNKIESISEGKDLKLREIILSETDNRLGAQDKSLSAKIVATKEVVYKDIAQVKSLITGLKATIEKVDERVKELEVYKYSKEGKMGAIIISIDLLEDSINRYDELKKIDVQDSFTWKIRSRLEGLIEEIGDLTLEQEYVVRIEKQLKKIEDEQEFKDLISKLRSKFKTP